MGAAPPSVLGPAAKSHLSYWTPQREPLGGAALPAHVGRPVLGGQDTHSWCHLCPTSYRHWSHTPRLGAGRGPPPGPAFQGLWLSAPMRLLSQGAQAPSQAWGCPWPPSTVHHVYKQNSFSCKDPLISPYAAQRPRAPWCKSPCESDELSDCELAREGGGQQVRGPRAPQDCKGTRPGTKRGRVGTKAGRT